MSEISEEYNSVIDLAIRMAHAEGIDLAAALIVKEEFDNANIIADFLYAAARVIRSGKQP